LLVLCDSTVFSDGIPSFLVGHLQIVHPFPFLIIIISLVNHVSVIRNRSQNGCKGITVDECQASGVVVKDCCLRLLKRHILQSPQWKAVKQTATMTTRYRVECAFLDIGST
jgi:hypothetical protein